MKTLIETKTGKIVNAGDVITLDGSAHVLTDFDVPGLVGRGILTFACVTSYPKENNQKATSKVDKTIICTTINSAKEDIPHEIPYTPEEVYMPMQLTHPKLQAIFFDWGYNKGLHTEEEIKQAVAVMWQLHPMSLLQIALKAMADEWNFFDMDKYQGPAYAFSVATGKVVPINVTEEFKYTEYVALFDSKKAINEALEVVEELTDILFPYGE